MIRTIVRRTVRFIGSAVVATVLLVVTLAYSAVATFVPQGAAGDPNVTAWASAHPALGPVTRVLGMHQAFSSYLFLACVALLAVSTVLCSWQRTKVALARTRALTVARTADAAGISASADATVPVEPHDERADAELLESAARALDDLGIETRRDREVLRSISPAWSVWGSPVFHWALVAFMLAIVVAGMQRSDGRMGLAVGETKPHSPSSYGYLSAGPLHAWEPVTRSIRLDRFEESFERDGLDYGPTPTVSLLDAEGAVIKTQRVYPNNPLKSGSITIHSDDYGLAVRLSILDAAGNTVARGIQYVDFDTSSTSGTRPLGGIVLRSADGAPAAQVSVTVPLDTVNGKPDYWMPASPAARLVVTAADGTSLADRVLQPGQTLDAGIGQSLRVTGIDWYYRLSVVDDATTPVLYVLLTVAFLGLTVSLVTRQHLLVISVVRTQEGRALAVRMRLWRNVPSEREAIIERLSATTRSTGKGVQ